MAQIKISLEPLQDALWQTHEPTGAAFLIAPLDGEADQDITRECTDISGNVDSVLFAVKVAKRCGRGWKGVGGKQGELPCNEDNLEKFARKHAFTIMPWFIRRSRSLDHYRVQEVEEAKKG